MSEQTVEALRISGLAHVISISGLHMALAAGLFFVGVRILLSLSPTFAHRWPTKKIAAAGALMAALAYLTISGVQVSALRAFIMTATMLVAVMLDRPAISLRNLALAALVILCLWPSQVLGPSFQMSFAATAALIAGYAALRRAPRADGWLPPGLLPPLVRAPLDMVSAIALSSLIGGLSTAIFAAEHFHRIGLFGLPANIAAMPIVSFIVMPAGLVAMVLMPFGLDEWPLRLMGVGLDVTIAIAKMVAGWGDGGGVGRLPGWFLPVMSAGFVLLTLLRTPLRHAGTVLIAAALVAVIVFPHPAPGVIVIAEAGDLVALTGSGNLASNRSRPPGFIFEQWQQALQLGTHRPPEIEPTAARPDLTQALADRERPAADIRALADKMTRAVLKAADASPGRFVCYGKVYCVASADLAAGNTLHVATIDDPRLIGPACDVADLVVTPRRMALKRCRSGAPIIDANVLRVTGALEVVPNVGTGPQRFTLEAAFDGIPRPWQEHRRYDWKTDSFDRRPVSDALSPPLGPIY